MYYIVQKNYINNTTSVSDFSISDIENYLENFLGYLKERLLHSNIVYKYNKDSYYFTKIESIVNKGYIYNSNIIKKTNLYKLKFVAVNYDMFNLCDSFKAPSCIADIDGDSCKLEECVEVASTKETMSEQIMYDNPSDDNQSRLQLELKERFKYKNFGLNRMKMKIE